MFEARFQSFDNPKPAATGPRVESLRSELKSRDLSGFILPRADRYQNEYVPPSEERLAWLTGFTGSAGCAIVLEDKALLFTDGRYTLQARDQVDGAVFEIVPMAEASPAEWLERHLPAGARLGYDPWLHTADGAERIGRICGNVGAALVPTEPNPIDALWTGRPAPPSGPIVLHDLRYAGEYPASKIARIRAEMESLRADALVISDPHNVAWTFNIRGSDVEHTPLPLAFAILPKNERPTLFAEADKLSNMVRDRLAEVAEILPPEEFNRQLAALGVSKAAVRLDQATCADAIAKLIAAEGGRIVRGADPITMLKAVKNPVEIEGANVAQRRDGAALTRFLAWFDREAPTGRITEIDAVEALETFRRETGALKDISFPTIAGSGPNGAIVHYRVTRASNRRIRSGDLFLIDSGGQYEDGTTDVTRTVAVGEPTEQMRDRFTRVLKGHIAIAQALFPDGTTGAQIDPFARRFLWQVGLDYDHGTGHGVGSYLSVHEGPARISKAGTVPLETGMILSNEPGYYKAGEYGIRIENLLIVSAPEPVPGGERPMHSFETLTLAPIDRRLVDVSLLDQGERTWLNDYHARVWDTVESEVDSATRAWLERATAPLA